MNEGWVILGGVFVGAVVVSELLARLVGPPRAGFLFRLGRGVSTAVKAAFTNR